MIVGSPELVGSVMWPTSKLVRREASPSSMVDERNASAASFTGSGQFGGELPGEFLGDVDDLLAEGMEYMPTGDDSDDAGLLNWAQMAVESSRGPSRVASSGAFHRISSASNESPVGGGVVKLIDCDAPRTFSPRHGLATNLCDSASRKRARAGLGDIIRENIAKKEFFSALNESSESRVDPVYTQWGGSVFR